MTARSVPAVAASALIGLLVILFIAWPLGAMLVRSVAIDRPAPLAALRQLTVEALELLEPDQRAAAIDRWVASAKPRERMEATAAALELNGLPAPWDRKAPFDAQIAAAEAALAALVPAARAAVEADLPIAIVMLHKRIPLAFQVRDGLTEEAFDHLRSGKVRSYGLDHYFTVLREERMRNAAWNSLRLAAITTTATTLLAFLLAFGVNRGAVAGAPVARYGILVPLVSPPVVIATAAILLFGRNGLVTKDLLQDELGLIDASLSNLYGFSGVVLAQVLSTLPPAFIVLDNVLSKHDGRLEEAAAIQGASFAQTFWRITLPMAQPGLIRAATLVFILSMTDFGNPLVIGKDLPVLAGVLYDEMIGFSNTQLSSALAVWLVVPAICVYALLIRLGRRRRFETAEVAPSQLPVPAAVRGVLTALAWSLIGFTVVIYGAILLGAFVRVWGQDFSFTPHHFTAVDAVAGFTSEYVGVTPVWTSLKIALIAAPFGGLLAVAVAYLAERARGLFNETIAFLVLLPAILPGVVFGIGYIVAFNAPFGIKALSLSGTEAIVTLNIVFGNIFVGVLAGRAMLRRLDSAVDEAAEILGASLLQRFAFVTLPMMRRAALLGTLYVFVDGLCTFSAVTFLEGPDTDLASVAIFQSASVSYYGIACAMSVTILLIVFTVMGALALIDRFGPMALRDPLEAPRPVTA